MYAFDAVGSAMAWRLSSGPMNIKYRRKASAPWRGHDLVGRHHVAQRLGHLGHDLGELLAGLLVEEAAVAFHHEGRRDLGLAGIEVGVGEDHALVVELVERLATADEAQIEQDLVPESAVQEVQHRVLGAADVEIDRKPVLLDRGVDEAFLVLRVCVAQVVPAGAGPLRHRVGFATALAACDRICHAQPFDGVGQRRFAGAGGLETLHLGRRTGSSESGTREMEPSSQWMRGNGSPQYRWRLKSQSRRR